MGYTWPVRYHILTTDHFNRWLAGIRDRRAARAIAQRLDRAAAGNLGNIKSVGKGVSEMRVFAGPGYRLYFSVRDGELIILLCGGTKSSQSRDIVRAQQILSEVEF